MAPTERSPSAPARSMIDDRRPPRPSADAVQETAAGLLAEARAALDQGRPTDALDLLVKAVGLDPEHAEAHCELGRALNNLGRLTEAREALQAAVRLAPESGLAWNRLGHVCRRLGDVEAAGDAFRRAVTLDPASAPAMSNLASILLSEGEVEEGIDLFRRAAEADPADPGHRARLGDALLGLGRLDGAEKAYRLALSLAPDHGPALAGLGALESARGSYALAEKYLRQALKRQPGDAVALASLVHVLELQGRSEEALRLLEEAPWAKPPGWAAVAAARQLHRLGRGTDAAARLETIDMDSLDSRSRAAALNLRGWLLDAEGDYGAAFRAFQEANRISPGDFVPADFVATVDRLTRFFTRERLGCLPASGCDTDRPVFIVGMPRSGTSLVEQMLGSHSRVHACGERTALYRLPRLLSGGSPGERWPECLADLGPEAMAEAAREYLDGEGDRTPDTCRATDKLPANFLNLGLVQLLFPGARVIYCRRDPMDTGLSCFQQDFQSPGMAFSRNLSHIGLYQQGCQRLMEHWGAVLDLKIHVLDYGNLVTDTAREAKRLVSFLGLDWEEECLQFHRSERVVRTASFVQVRSPVYRSSIGRWKSYEPWLGPLREALSAPWPGQNDRAGG